MTRTVYGIIQEAHDVAGFTLTYSPPEVMNLVDNIPTLLENGGMFLVMSALESLHW